MEMLLTGDPVKAERLHALGYVNRLTEPGQAKAEALKLAEAITVNAPLAVRLSRNLLVESVQLASEAEQRALSDAAIPQLAATEDFREGPKALCVAPPRLPLSRFRN